MIANKLQAMFGERLSEASVNNRWIGDRVIGAAAVRVVYKVSSTPAESIPPSSWGRLPRDRGGTRIPWPFPSSFRRAGVFHPNFAALASMHEELSSEYPSRPLHQGVGFRFGKYVLVALADQLPEEFGMRFREPSAVTVGLSDPVTRAFFVPEHALGEEAPNLTFEQTEPVSALIERGVSIY